MLFSVISNAWIRIACLFMLWFEWKQRIHALLMTENSVATLTQRDREEKNCWINVVIFIFFAYKKYSHCFITLGLNHWWQMDYFDDVFYTYFVPWQCNLLGSQWDSYKLPGFHPKYLELCSEDEQRFYWFGKFGVEYPFNPLSAKVTKLRKKMSYFIKQTVTRNMV